MESTSEIERREFTVVRKGYDPDEVRTFLQELAEAGLRPSPVFEQLGESVADLLETAHRTAQSIESHARDDAERLVADAEAAKAEAEADAQRVRDEAETAAAERLAEAERIRAEADAAVVEASAKATQLVADAEAIAANVAAESDHLAQARIDAAEEQARERATTVIESAKRRLRKLLEAEGEVHARLVAALASVNAEAGQPLMREDEELLDQAFAEFFSDDVETEPSRAWILSE
jgi:DivIVA domain-containing protein